MGFEAYRLIACTLSKYAIRMFEFQNKPNNEKIGLIFSTFNISRLFLLKYFFTVLVLGLGSFFSFNKFLNECIKIAFKQRVEKHY